MTTTFADYLAARFGGVLRSGAHKPDGQACVLEAWSQYEGRDWTDDPAALVLPDLRPLNDGPWPDDATRTAWMTRVIVAVAPVWRDRTRRQAFVEAVALGTVRRGLPPVLREVGLEREAAVCEEAATLAAARSAADAAGRAASAAWSVATDAWSVATAAGRAAAAARRAADAAGSAAAAAWSAADAARSAAAAGRAAAAARSAADAAGRAADAAGSAALMTACEVWIAAADAARGKAEG